MALKPAFSVLLTAVMLCSLVLGSFNFTNAQSIPKPSVPEFTAAVIDKSYDVPPTISVDPYNGQTVTTKGYHVKNLVLEIRIKNENFTPFTTDSGGHQVNYYYNIRWKGHFEENWANMFAANYGSGYFPRATGVETVFLTDGEYSCGFNIHDMNDFSPDDQIGLQVKAMIGYVADPGPLESEVFVGETSGWSNTQTIPVTAGSVATSTPPNPTADSTLTPTPSVVPSTTASTPVYANDSSAYFQLGWLEIGFLGLGILVALLVVAIVFLSRKVKGLEHKMAI
jgi:hypothetical protein